QNGGTDNVRYGDIFTDDQFTEAPYEKFDYLLANPPFGVDWKRQQKEIQQQHDKLGFDGRFGAGLPRVNDGSLLFLQHMISKFEPVQLARRSSASSPPLSASFEAGIQRHAAVHENARAVDVIGIIAGEPHGRAADVVR